MEYYINKDGELYHHGIKGQEWGKRRYQNPDGTLTPEGKARLQKENYKTTKKVMKKSYVSDEGKIIPALSKKNNMSDIRQKVTTKHKALAKAGKELDKAQEDYLNSKEAISKHKSICNKLEKEGWEDVSYDKAYDLVIQDWKKNNPTGIAKNKEYENARKEYESSIKSAANDLLGKYGNQKVKTKTGYEADAERFVSYAIHYDAGDYEKTNK